MPRRYHAYPPEFQVLNVLSSAGASILGVGYLIPMIYLMWSLRYGTARRREPVGRGRPRVDDDVAAADGELRGDADRHVGRVRLPARRWRVMLPDGRRTAHAHHPALAHQFDNLEQQSEAATLGMWVFLVTEVLFFGGLFAAYCDLSQLVSRGVRGGEPRARRHARHDQHRRAHHQQPDDGAGRARRPDWASAGC